MITMATIKAEEEEDDKMATIKAEEEKDDKNGHNKNWRGGGMQQWLEWGGRQKWPKYTFRYSPRVGYMGICRD